MAHPGVEIQKLIYDQLSNNVALQTLIGAGRIFDDVPRDIKPPYITFGESLHFDWSTSTEQGMEHEITLQTWSRNAGRKQLFDIQEIITQMVSQLPVGSMQEHHLINITHEETRIEPRQSGRNFLATSTLRAVSEPIA